MSATSNEETSMPDSSAISRSANNSDAISAISSEMQQAGPR